jgi:hypothetical protein
MALDFTELDLTVAASPGASIDADLLTEIKANFTGLFTSLPVYSDNAAAISGGLTAGEIYRTSTGVLMVVYAP